uniref:Uncharacterized protein n=1 Tax=Glossina austeni TaxID=7395 RepID=A0A1A9UFT2_GLOAU
MQCEVISSSTRNSSSEKEALTLFPSRFPSYLNRPSLPLKRYLFTLQHSTRLRRFETEMDGKTKFLFIIPLRYLSGSFAADIVFTFYLRVLLLHSFLLGINITEQDFIYGINVNPFPRVVCEKQLNGINNK